MAVLISTQSQDRRNYANRVMHRFHCARYISAAAGSVKAMNGLALRTVAPIARGKKPLTPELAAVATARFKRHRRKWPPMTKRQWPHGFNLQICTTNIAFSFFVLTIFVKSIKLRAYLVLTLTNSSARLLLMNTLSSRHANSQSVRPRPSSRAKSLTPKIDVAQSPSKSTSQPLFQPGSYEPEDSLLYLLRKAMVAIGQVVNDRTKLGGTSIPQWVPLYKVYVGHADTVAELARSTAVDAGAMTRLLDRLEAKELCHRVRSESDRRVVHIQLTEKGKAAAEQVPIVLCRVYNEVLRDFSWQEWQQFQHMLKQLIASAEGIKKTASEESAE